MYYYTFLCAFNDSEPSNFIFSYFSVVGYLWFNKDHVLVTETTKPDPGAYTPHIKCIRSVCWTCVFHWLLYLFIAEILYYKAGALNLDRHRWAVSDTSTAASKISELLLEGKEVEFLFSPTKSSNQQRLQVWARACSEKSWLLKVSWQIRKKVRFMNTLYESFRDYLKSLL